MCQSPTRSPSAYDRRSTASRYPPACHANGFPAPPAPPTPRSTNWNGVVLGPSAPKFTSALSEPAAPPVVTGQCRCPTQTCPCRPAQRCEDRPRQPCRRPSRPPDQAFVGNRDHQIVGKRRMVAVEVHRLHQARQVQRHRGLGVVAQRMINRTKIRERPRAVIVDRQREHVMCANRPTRSPSACDRRSTASRYPPACHANGFPAPPAPPTPRRQTGTASCPARSAPNSPAH